MAALSLYAKYKHSLYIINCEEKKGAAAAVMLITTDQCRHERWHGGHHSEANFFNIKKRKPEAARSMYKVDLMTDQMS